MSTTLLFSFFYFTIEKNIWYVLTALIIYDRMYMPNNYLNMTKINLDFLTFQGCFLSPDKNAYLFFSILYVRISEIIVWRQLELCVFCALASAGALFYLLTIKSLNGKISVPNDFHKLICPKQVCSFYLTIKTHTLFAYLFWTVV